MSRRFVKTLLLLLLAGLAVRSAGVEPEDTKPPYRPLLVVRTMPWDELAGHPEATVRGVVIRSQPTQLVIQDPTGGLYVNISQAIQRGWLPGPLAADVAPVAHEVEIEGCLAAGGFAPIMIPRTIRLLGPKPLPEPRRKDPIVLLTGGYDSELVEFTGIVQAVEEETAYWKLKVNCRQQDVVVAVARDCVDAKIAGIKDAEVRIRGVAYSLFTPRGEFRQALVYVEQPGWIEVVEPSPAAVLMAKPIPLPDVGRFRACGDTGHLLRTRGTVIHAIPGDAVFLQEGAWGIRVQTRSSERWQPGDEVEVVGFLDRRLPVAGISHGSLDRIATGPPPEPVPISPREVLEVNRTAAKRFVRADPGDYQGCLIRFPARLVEARGPLPDVQLVLDAAGITVLAELHDAGEELLERLRPGSELSLTGILQPADGLPPAAAQPPTVSLLLRSPADIVVTRPPSPWTPRRLAALLGASTVALGLVAAWAWWLRRQRERLEVMVAERTRELAKVREQEKESEERQRQLLEQKLRTSLTASAVAHEINQPLSRLLLKCQLEADQGGHNGDGFIDTVVHEAERVVTTIEKMKVLLRNVETSHKPVDLAQVLTSAVIQVKRLLATHAVALRRTGPEAGCVVEADDVQLQFAISNLLRNGVEAIVAGGGERREIEVGIAEDGDGVRLTVGDSGPGWPGGAIADVLLASSKPEGTGIGLFVVTTAVENHAGRLTVGESRLGGAEFRIWLPRRREAEGGMVSAAEPALEQSMAGRIPERG